MKNENICVRCCIGNKEAVFKATVIFLIVTSVFIIFKTIGTYKTNETIGQKVVGNTISFSGKGEIFKVPDIATFFFSAQETAKTPTEAQALSTKIINTAIDYLKKNGIKEKDIKTTNYNLSPRYEWKNTKNQICLKTICPVPVKNKTRVLIGYEVNQQIQVKIRDIKKAGSLLAGIGKFGLNNISGLTFSIENKEAVQRDARKLAIEKAKNKAEELSKDLGVTLVKIVNFYESRPYQPVYGLSNKLKYTIGQLQTPQIPVGENKIVSNVTLTYEIR